MTKFSATHGNDSDARNVTVSYTLWVGTNITENYTVIITAPRNISFFNVMQMAADMDSHFVFQVCTYITCNWKISVAMNVKVFDYFLL